MDIKRQDRKKSYTVCQNSVQSNNTDKKKRKNFIALVGITLVALIRHLHLNINKPEEKKES